MPFVESRHLLSIFLVSTLDFFTFKPRLFYSRLLLSTFTLDFYSRVLLSTLDNCSRLSTFRYTRLTIAQLRSAGHISLQANVWPVQIRTRKSCSKTQTLNLSKKQQVWYQKKRNFFKISYLLLHFQSAHGLPIYGSEPRA